MKKIIIILLTCFILCGCGTKNLINEDYIKNIVNDKEYVIIDVRTKEEYDELHIKDSINIPVDKINEDIEIEKYKIIFVYCKSGNRSSIAYSTLTNLGYTVYDLGGINNIDLEKE